MRDWRIAEEWPEGAKPVTKKAQYDDLYRVKRVDYQYSDGDDVWKSPFEAENSGNPALQDTRRAKPSPHVAFDKRVLSQSYAYDWLGNTSASDDDAHGFYDRSLGTIGNGPTGGTNPKPYQLTSADNLAKPGTRTGRLAARYDDAGNLTRLAVDRGGPCLPTGSACNQLFAYEWDEVGRLNRARRWDISSSAVTSIDGTLPTAPAAADLSHAYDAGDQRVIKTARDAAGAERHTVYIFDCLELRRAEWKLGGGIIDDFDYAVTATTEVGYLFANGVRLARLVYEPTEHDVPTFTGAARLHVFFELGDHLGSTSVVLDKATGELVERGTYEAYGSKESDYRPERWSGFREDYGFTGKEDDVEVGLTYFGRRFLSTHLNRWVSADPLTVHGLGADLNVYAYVSGAALKSVDPLGLDEATLSSEPGNASDQRAAEEMLVARGSVTPYSPGAMAPAPKAQPKPAPAKAASGDGGSGGTAASIEESRALFNYLESATKRGEIFHEGLDVVHPVLSDKTELSQAYGGSQGAGGSERLPEVPKLTLEVGFVEGNVKQAAVPNPQSAAARVLSRSAAQLEANKVAGAVQERFLLREYGGRTQVSLPTSQGRRVLDNLAGGVARESKVGRTFYSKQIRRQVAKDTELLKTPGSGVTKYEWHFGPSQTGVGPSSTLRKALEDAGIRVIIHD